MATYEVEHKVLTDRGLPLWDLGGNILIGQVKVGALAKYHVVLPLDHV